MELPKEDPCPDQEPDSQELYQLLYEDLYQRAQHMMATQPKSHTLQASALVNEAYLKLSKKTDFADQNHFLATASRAMRQILVDRARSRRARKADRKTSLDGIDQLVDLYNDPATDLQALDTALAKLEEIDPEMAKAVELRFFGGQSVARVSEMLGIAPRTFERRWATTRAWLSERIEDPS